MHFIIYSGFDRDADISVVKQYPPESTVDLLLGSNAQLHAIFAGELVLKNFCKFFCSHKELLSAHTLVLF